MTEIIYDKPEQLQKIQANLLPEENIIAVYDAIGAGTGFIALTDRRVILQDNSFVGKKIALTSLPYKRIHTVAYVSDKSFLGNFASTSTIAINAGSAMYQVQFRGDAKAKHTHDVILHYVLHS